MIKNSFKLPLILGVASLSLASCNDYDAGITSDVFKQKEYADNFKQVFGETDPNQDWSMAVTLTASVDLKSDLNGTLLIYTTAPTVAGSKFLGMGDVRDGKATVNFSADKSSNLLYARIVNEMGQVLEGGYFDVVDNAIMIGNAGTRTVATDNPTDNGITKTAYEQNVARMPEHAVELLNAGNYNSYADFTEHIVVSEYYSYDKTYTASDRVSTALPNLYLLNGVDYSNHDNGYSLAELKPIFSTYKNANGETKDGVFKEATDHIDQYMRTEKILDPNVTLTVKEKGEVELDFMWRGTSSYDYFGYYYFNDGEDTRTSLTAEQLWNINKYILINTNKSTVNGTETDVKMINEKSSLTMLKLYNPDITRIWNAEKGVNDEYYSDKWDDPINRDGMNCPSDINGNDKTLIVGTKIRLVHYAADGTASYNFPAGTKIGFFLCERGSQNGVYKFFFSDCALNYQLTYHNHTSHDNSGSHDGMYERPFAAAFNYDGRTFVGFGDESGDCDLNDLVFAASNVQPLTDLTPDDLVEPLSNEWLFACEDLGGTYDYDFNDIVWSVSQKLTKVTKYSSTGSVESESYNYGNVNIKLYAAGGTLPVELIYNDESLGEVHQAFGQSAAAIYTPVNVGATTTVAPKNLKTIEASSNININDYKSKFKVKVQGVDGQAYYVTAPNISAPAGSADAKPQMILLPGEWRWPQEGIFINAAYPGFTSWTNDATWTSWSANYVASKTTSR